MPKAFADMNRSALERAELAADVVHRELVDAFINAGRGRETMLEIRESAAKGFDSLAWDYVKAIEVCCQIRDEKDARRRYHGSLHRISRAER